MMRGKAVTLGLSRRGILAVAAVILVGVGVTSMLFLEMRRSAMAEFRAGFVTTAQHEGSHFRSRLRQSLSAVRVLGQVFTAIKQVGFDEFTVFSRHVLISQTELRSLEWAPLVPAGLKETMEARGRQTVDPAFAIFERDGDGKPNPVGARDAYFPVLYVEPQDEGARSVLGFDMGSAPLRRILMDLARDSGEIVVSPRVTLAGKTVDSGVITVAAVYRGDMPARTVAERGKALKGFAMAVYDIDFMMSAVIQGGHMGTLDFELADYSVPGLPDTLHRHVGLGDASPGWRRWFQPEPLTHHETAPFGGRLWGITFTTSAAYLDQNASLTHWLVPPIGGLLTLLLAALAWTMVRQRRILEEMVRERTETLWASERRFRDLVDATPDFITRVDSNGKILMLNRAATAVFGLEAGQCIGRPAFDAVHPDDREQTQANFQRWVESGVVDVSFENRLLDAGGRSHDMSWNIRLRRDEAGGIVDITSVARDVTERKLADEELRRHKNNLEELVREQTQSIVDVLRHAQAANRAKSVFLANMSHELRTPLTSVIGFSQVMAHDASLTADQRRRLAIINRSGSHLLTLINDVLELSKLEAGGVVLDDQPTDPGEAIATAVEMLRERAEQKGLTFAVRTSGLPSGVVVDGVKLRQVLLNLLSNAIKFTERGGVTLEATGLAVGPGLVRLDITVQDTGIGITAEDRDRVFEPFTQLAPSEMQVGTGLGLSICRQYVSMMGGTLTLDSHPGQGASFHFRLVLATCEGPAAQTVPAGRVVAIESGARRKILVVEGNPDTRLLHTSFLLPLGFDVANAGDGDAALAAVEMGAPDLVIMDWRLPGMDGAELIHRIRARGDIIQPLIVMLTIGAAFGEQRQAALTAGADDVLPKSFEPNALLEVLGRQLAIRYRYEAAQCPPLSFNAALTAGDVAILPMPIRAALAKAIRELNLAKLSRTLGELGPEHSVLARQIKALADGARYRELWHLLEGEAE